MMHNNHFMFWAARSIGKTWLTALFCVVRCILFPCSKICVASATRPQANEVLQKIENEFLIKYRWGSENLRREISECSICSNKAEIKFHNGSWIKVVTASDNARGARANVLVIDEFRMVDKNTIDTVLRRFMGDPRQPPFLSLPEYKNKEELLETNIEIYMSSCWFKSHWSYRKSQDYTVNLLGGRDGYFVCALPYQMSIKEGLKKRSEIEDEMSENSFDATTFSMEMECLAFGNTEGAFFSFDDISECRKLQTTVYPDNKLNKIPDLLLNERRILSVDIALMASKKHKNDATSIIINSAIPINNNDYIANIIYTENHDEGILTNDLALLVRRLFKIYKCTDLAIDAKGVGAGVTDLLIQDMVDSETGEFYPALSCCNNKDISDRCKVSNAPEVIWAINASASFNTEICTLLRTGFQNKKINLLVSEDDVEDRFKEKIKGYKSMTVDEQLKYKMPYINTTLLIYELINLQHEIKGTNIKITEKSGARKDRYSSLAYNYWVQTQLARELSGNGNNTKSGQEFINAFRQLNKKPILY